MYPGFPPRKHEPTPRTIHGKEATSRELSTQHNLHIWGESFREISEFRVLNAAHITLILARLILKSLLAVSVLALRLREKETSGTSTPRPLWLVRILTPTECRYGTEPSFQFDSCRLNKHSTAICCTLREPHRSREPTEISTPRERQPGFLYSSLDVAWICTPEGLALGGDHVMSELWPWTATPYEVPREVSWECQWSWLSTSVDSS